MDGLVKRSKPGQTVKERFHFQNPQTPLYALLEVAGSKAHLHGSNERQKNAFNFTQKKITPSILKHNLYDMIF